MSANNFHALDYHYAHEIVCVRYTDKTTNTIVNVALECQDCGEVLLDYDNEEITNG
jgi:hypothetical protein